jgi:uncharacterized membrane protein
MIPLGLRLAVRGGRETMIRLVTLVVAVGLGSGLLLAAVSGINAFNTQSDASAWLRQGHVLGKHRAAPPGTAPLWWHVESDAFGDQNIARVDVAATGRASPVPPGIPRDPGPGQYYASPALAALLRGTPADELADRYPGHLAGTIGETALPSPDSLVIVIGHSPAQLAGALGAVRVTKIATSLPAGVSVDTPIAGMPADGMDLVFSVIALAILVPVLIFIATATRLSAARREQRFAAMRLAGATRRQVSLVAAVESAVAAIGGVAVGFGMFFLLRIPLSAIPFTGQPFFPAQLSLSLPDILAIALGVPLAASIVSRVALRRVHISPLGVMRRVTPKPPTAWRLLPLLAGVAELGFFVVHGHPVAVSGQVLAFVTGFGLIIVGLILALFVTTVAVATITTSEAKTPQTSYIGTATVNVLTDQLTGFYGPALTSVSAPSATELARVRGIAGVTGVVEVHAAAKLTLPASLFGSGNSAGLVSCAQLAGAAALGRCPAGTSVAEFPVSLVGFPARAVADTTWPAERVPAQRLNRMGLSGIDVATNGSQQAIERARTILDSAYPMLEPPGAAGGGFENSGSSGSTYQQLADVIILASLPIAGCTLAAGIAGGLLDRKRAFSMLRLTGARLVTLRWVVTLESAVPLLAVAVVAIGAGFAAAAMYASAEMKQSLVAPGPEYYLITVAGVAISVAIIAATFPLLRRITGPEAARNE